MNRNHATTRVTEQLLAASTQAFDLGHSQLFVLLAQAQEQCAALDLDGQLPINAFVRS